MKCKLVGVLTARVVFSFPDELISVYNVTVGFSVKIQALFY
jgi:hypothetical protein